MPQQKQTTRWNGEPCSIQHITVLLSEEQEQKTFWFSVFAGTERRVLKITQGGQSFIIDNEDGQGIDKVINGGMFYHPSRHYDRCIYTEQGETPEHLRVEAIDIEKTREIRLQVDEHIKSVDPAKFEKMKALEEQMKSLYQIQFKDKANPFKFGNVHPNDFGQ